MILVTGGTGFLGKFVVEELKKKYQVAVLSRNASGDFKGDLTRWNAGLDLVQLKSKYKFEALLHMAGLYDFSAPALDCYVQNLAGTKTALNMAMQLDIPVFLNTSSIAASINSKKETVSPYDINFDYPFPDPYAETKATAEYLIRNWEDQPQTRVNFRLGVLVGDTKDGKIERIDGPYRAPDVMTGLKALYGFLPVSLWPGHGEKYFPLVPVDMAAKGIVGLTEWALQNQPKGYKSFNLTPKQGLSVKDFYAAVSKHIGLPPKQNILTENIPDALVKTAASWIAGFPQTDLHYLLNFPNYDTQDTRDILGEWCPEFSSYERVFWRGYEEYLQNR